LDQLTSVQLSEWEAFDRIDPIGSWRDDFRVAFLSSLINNLVIAVHGKKGTAMTRPIDFMPDWDLSKINEPKKQTVEEMKQIMIDVIQSAGKRREQEKKRIGKLPPGKLI
jgi:hypothetical protein